MGSNSWFLDVADIGPITPPTRLDGALRKCGIHYMDLHEATSTVEIHSDPIVVRVSRASDIAIRFGSSGDSRDELHIMDVPDAQAEVRPSAPKLAILSFQEFDAWTKEIGSKAIGCFVSD